VFLQDSYRFIDYSVILPAESFVNTGMEIHADDKVQHTVGIVYGLERRVERIA
jgi:hypothetical protein